MNNSIFKDVKISIDNKPIDLVRDDSGKPKGPDNIIIRTGTDKAFANFHDWCCDLGRALKKAFKEHL